MARKLKRNLCECGCKQACHNRFVHGHNNKGLTGVKCHLYGRKLTEEHRKAIGRSVTGKVFSLETRKKISDAQKGKPKWSPEDKERISRQGKGRKQSKETIELRVSKLRGQKRTKEQRENISKSLKGKPMTESWKLKRSETQKRLWEDPEYRERMSLVHKGRPAWNKGVPMSKETQRKLRESLKGRPAWNKGCKLSEEHRRNLSISQKKAWGDEEHTYNSKEFRENRSRVCKRNWLDDEYQRMMREARRLSPNKTEQRFNKLLQKLFPGEWKYVGDFQFWLGGKNPDFMNINGQKKLIEIFGDHWHSESMVGCPKEVHERERVDHFKEYGFDTLVIWENELKNKDKVINKLDNFIRGLE